MKTNKTLRIVLEIIFAILAIILIYVVIRYWEQGDVHTGQELTEAYTDTQIQVSARDEGTTIVLGNREYQMTHPVRTYLFLGTDASGNEGGTGEEYQGSMADTLMLLVIDEQEETYGILQLNRDTITDVVMLGYLGSPIGTQKMQISLAHGFGDGKEESCEYAQQAVEALLDAKRVLAIVRKQDTPFLTALCARQDAFVVDLDDPAPALGCVVMASGLGRRFGGNKLMADFCGAPLIANALALAALPLLACRIVVTRSEEVEALCNAQGVPVLRHAQPYRSDTVRLGLAALLGKEPALRGCLFLPGDQPLLTQQSVEALALAAAPDAIVRLCAADGTPGSPVLFGADYFSELLHLPDGRGGNAVVRAHPGSVRLVSARNDAELRDVDTREDLNQLRQLTNR